ncbi:hypothetical protein RND81_05G153400 [Saponaria officinalis]|uniref:Uncharacterized protein n=1 Tax=Saponaria officinalis TaxID=3572 RepID=A0AAW1L1A0_SAPOF
MLLELDEIWSVISKEVAESAINDLVRRASSNNFFVRKIKRQLLSSMISEIASSFCTVYTVFKGKFRIITSL